MSSRFARDTIFGHVFREWFARAAAPCWDLSRSACGREKAIARIMAPLWCIVCFLSCNGKLQVVVEDQDGATRTVGRATFNADVAHHRRAPIRRCFGRRRNAPRVTKPKPTTPTISSVGPCSTVGLIFFSAPRKCKIKGRLSSKCTLSFQPHTAWTSSYVQVLHFLLDWEARIPPRSRKQRGWYQTRKHPGSNSALYVHDPPNAAPATAACVPPELFDNVRDRLCDTRSS